MAVKIVISGSYSVPPPAINKYGVEYKHKHRIPIKDVCYKYDRGNSIGFVLNPKIDYLVISLPLEELDEAEYFIESDNSKTPKTYNALVAEATIASYLMTNSKNKEKDSWVSFSKSDLQKHGKKAYEHFLANCQLLDFPGLAAVQVGKNITSTNVDYATLPKSKNLKAGMRLTIIPSEWTKVDVNKFWNELASISLQAITREYVAKYGRITRIDWAVDFLNVGTGDLFLQKVDSARKKVIYSGRHGGVETQYLGPNKNKKNSQNFKAYIYDKLKKNNEGLSQENKDELLRTRFEVRHTPYAKKTQYWNLKGLTKPSAKKTNCFEKYNIIDFFASQPEGAGVMWHLFGDSCRIRGQNNALDMLYADLRGAYEANLIKSSKVCWKPEALWSAIHKHVNFLLDTESNITIVNKNKN